MSYSLSWTLPIVSPGIPCQLPHRAGQPGRGPGGAQSSWCPWRTGDCPPGLHWLRPSSGISPAPLAYRVAVKSLESSAVNSGCLFFTSMCFIMFVLLYKMAHMIKLETGYYW